MSIKKSSSKETSAVKGIRDKKNKHKPGTLKIGKNGRITLPKTLRQRLGLNEKTRLIIREQEGLIVLTPVTIHENPTEALYGSVPLTPPVDDPKETARRHLRNKMRHKAGEELIASLEKKAHRP